MSEKWLFLTPWLLAEFHFTVFEWVKLEQPDIEHLSWGQWLINKENT